MIVYHDKDVGAMILCQESFNPGLMLAELDPYSIANKGVIGPVNASSRG
jgi:hypothetical protein